MAEQGARPGWGLLAPEELGTSPGCRGFTRVEQEGVRVSPFNRAWVLEAWRRVLNPIRARPTMSAEAPGLPGMT